MTRIEEAAQSGASITFMSGDTGVTVPWSQLHDEAKALATALQVRGIGPGDHVALLGPTSRPLVTMIQATWLAGATVMVLPLPMRLASIEEFVHQTRVRVIKGDTSLLVIDDQLAEFISPEPGDPPTASFDELAGEAATVGTASWRRPPEDPERLAILQFTSGSTSEPKGVMLPDRVLCANLDAAVEAGDLQDDDVFISWLPLYHDMGLVGMLSIPMTIGRGLVLGAPQDFLARPLRWLEWMSDHRGTVTAGPNFSWVLATRALRRAEGLDLSSMRIALNGAEPVDPRSVEAFCAAAAPFGFRPEAVFPAFGMAELAIAGTFPVPLTGLRTDPVDRRVLEGERLAVPAEPGAEGTREFVRLGRAVPGLEIRVVDPDSGSELGAREVGELEIRGTSVTTGYYKNPDATAALFRDGWLRTGDLAYLLDGELVLCGRIKDVIILGGRNVFPEDIERAVATVDGVRPGNIIAFGVEGNKGHERVVVVAEAKGDDHDAIRHEVHHRAMEVSGVPPHEIVLVSPGTLPKTSSGKLQRSLCRQRFLLGELELVGASAG
ncbi:MAG: fatty acyl-AMP ligase [Acidimicrobiales bacterium]